MNACAVEGCITEADRSIELAESTWPVCGFHEQALNAGERYTTTLDGQTIFLGPDLPLPRLLDVRIVSTPLPDSVITLVYGYEGAPAGEWTFQAGEALTNARLDSFDDEDSPLSLELGANKREV